MATQSNFVVLDTERPKKNVASAYLVLLALALAAFLVSCVIDMNANNNAAKYGMALDDLRTEYSLIIFYLLMASAIDIIVIRGLRRIPIGLRLVICALVFGFAVHLSDKQLSNSQELAAAKLAFVEATTKCRVVARGELDCGHAISDAIKMRDNKLAAIGATMVGEWKVTAPRPQTRKINMAAAYIPWPF